MLGCDVSLVRYRVGVCVAVVCWGVVGWWEEEGRGEDFALFVVGTRRCQRSVGVFEVEVWDS